MTRAQMFKHLALGGASAAAVRAFPDSPQETAERVVAAGGVVPVSVSGPLHLHGDGQTITNCNFGMAGEQAAALRVTGRDE